MTLVSVIIPCFNGAAHVGDAIRSALNQRHRDIEVIVVDDGSTDESCDVLRSFGSDITWETGPNRGASAARNRGLELSRGSFIQYLDADDLLDTDKIETQLSQAEEAEDAISYCGRRTFNMDTPQRQWIDHPSHGGDDVMFALEKIVSNLAPLYRRAHVERVGGYRTDLACAQDYDFNLRLALAGCRFVRCDRVLATVRRRPVSISSNSLKVLRQMSELWRDLEAQLSASGQLTSERRRAIAMQFASAARVCIRAGEPLEAQELLAEARALDPASERLAYGSAAWSMRQVLGSALTERLVLLKRRLTETSGRPL